MAVQGIYSSLLSRPASTSALTRAKQPYERQAGSASGLGMPQQRNCPSGYTWNATQARCIPSTTPKSPVGYGYSVPNTGPSGTSQGSAQVGGGLTQNYSLRKSNQLSPYAQLLAQAYDINPGIANQAYPELGIPGGGSQVIPPQQMGVPGGGAQVVSPQKGAPMMGGPARVNYGTMIDPRSQQLGRLLGR